MALLWAALLAVPTAGQGIDDYRHLDSVLLQVSHTFNSQSPEAAAPACSDDDHAAAAVAWTARADVAGCADLAGMCADADAGSSLRTICCDTCRRQCTDNDAAAREQASVAGLRIAGCADLGHLCGDPFAGAKVSSMCCATCGAPRTCKDMDGAVAAHAAANGVNIAGCAQVAHLCEDALAGHMVSSWCCATCSRRSSVPAPAPAEPGSAGHHGSCGVKGTDDTPWRRMPRRVGDDGKIVNGQTASPCEWKWQACVMTAAAGQRESPGRCRCSGALVAERWVLTAAHCVAGNGSVQQAGGVTVALGEWGHFGGGAEVAHAVSRVVVHEGYDEQTANADVALLELEHPASMGDCIGAACLPEDDVADGSLCFVTGWGGSVLPSGRSDSVQILKESEVVTVSNQACSDKYGPGKVTDAMLCAVGDTGGFVDVCHGDSGGPLVCSSNGIWTVMGVVSWGASCADIKHPGVYARVHRVMDWISSSMAGTHGVPAASHGAPSASGPSGGPSSEGAPRPPADQDTGPLASAPAGGHPSMDAPPASATAGNPSSKPPGPPKEEHVGTPLSSAPGVGDPKADAPEAGSASAPPSESPASSGHQEEQQPQHHQQPQQQQQDAAPVSAVPTVGEGGAKMDVPPAGSADAPSSETPGSPEEKQGTIPFSSDPTMEAPKIDVPWAGTADASSAPTVGAPKVDVPSAGSADASSVSTVGDAKMDLPPTGSADAPSSGSQASPEEEQHTEPLSSAPTAANPKMDAPSAGSANAPSSESPASSQHDPDAKPPSSTPTAGDAKIDAPTAGSADAPPSESPASSEEEQHTEPFGSVPIAGDPKMDVPPVVSPSAPSSESHGSSEDEQNAMPISSVPTVEDPRADIPPVGSPSTSPSGSPGSSEDKQGAAPPGVVPPVGVGDAEMDIPAAGSSTTSFSGLSGPPHDEQGTAASGPVPSPLDGPGADAKPPLGPVPTIGGPQVGAMPYGAASTTGHPHMDAKAPSSVHAMGDPHMVNVFGQRFDLMQPGTHSLIHMPRGAAETDASLAVSADVRRVGSACEDMYIMALNVTGKWAETEHKGGLRFLANSTHNPKAMWRKFHKVMLKVVKGHTPGGTAYLNFLVKGLSRAGMRIGGLLGEDDHTFAASQSRNCHRRLMLASFAASERTAPEASVARASW